MDTIKNERWFPTGSVRDDAFWEKSLRLSTQRISLIATNIANADTPNYKASALDFKAALEQATSRAAPIGLTGTAAHHLTAPPQGDVNAFVSFRVSAQPSVDNNSVDMDVERAAFAESTVQHQFTLQRAIGEYKDQANWIKSLT